MSTSTEFLGPEQLEVLLNGPAVTPPAGTVSNLDNPPNIDAICYMTFFLCMSLATLAVVIRLYTKRFLIRCIAYEDCEYCSSTSLCHHSDAFQRLLYDWNGTNAAQPNAPDFTAHIDRLAFGACLYHPCSLKEVALEFMRGIYD